MNADRLSKLEALEELLNWYREERRACGFDFCLHEIEVSYGVVEADLASEREKLQALGS